MTHPTATQPQQARQAMRGVRLPTTILILLLLTSSSGCIWKLFSGGPPPEERIHDLFGTIQSITRDQLVVAGQGGREESFVMTDATIKGSPDLGVGTYVHVYFKVAESIREVTMVVEKK